MATSRFLLVHNRWRGHGFPAFSPCREVSPAKRCGLGRNTRGVAPHMQPERLPIATPPWQGHVTICYTLTTLSQQLPAICRVRFLLEEVICHDRLEAFDRRRCPCGRCCRP